jgi:hypothetical protein
MKDKTLIKGDVNELRCMLAFEEKGYCISIPFDGSSKYDFIADVEGKLLKIQCKSSHYYKDDTSIAFSCSCSTTNTQKTTRHAYSKQQIDYFMTTFDSYTFLIPVEETTNSEKILRLKEPKNNQIETINIASHYLFDNVLCSILNGIPIKRFIDTYIKSVDKNGQEEIWSYDRFRTIYNDRQIRYIKEAMRMNKMAYDKFWFREEFPNL